MMFEQYSHSQQIRRGVVAVVLVVLSGLVLTGCTRKQYQERADNQVYEIIQDIEKSIFGVTNEFTIDTKWSEMDPDEILSPNIVDQRTTTNTLFLSLDDALALAASQSRTYQSEKERLYLTALSLTGERHQFGPNFEGFSDLTLNSDEQVNLNSGIGLSQFFKTGGDLSVSLVNDILQYYTGDPQRSVVNTISIRLAQPLLRGFGKNNPNVENLKQAERDVIYAVRSYSYFQNEYAVQIVADYFDLLGLKNIIRNNYSNYVSQVESTRRLQERAVDRETQNDVNQAQQSELSSRNQYVNSIATYFNALDSFKINLAVPLGVRVYLDDTELDQLSEIGLIPVSVDKDKAFDLATEKNLLILNEIDAFEDAKRKVDVAADQLRAGLNFVGNASIDSERPTDYTNFDIDDVRYSFGLQLDLPLDRLNERNNYRSTLVSFESAIRTLELQLDGLKDTINRGVRTLEQRRQNYIIQTRAAEIARSRVILNQLLLEADRATVRDLVESQNAAIDAENAVVEALVSYQNARLLLLLDIGVIRTDIEDFWFASHLEDTPQIVAADYQNFEVSADAVITPDEVFNN